jgi:hypothetical protein
LRTFCTKSGSSLKPSLNSIGIRGIKMLVSEKIRGAKAAPLIFLAKDSISGI